MRENTASAMKVVASCMGVVVGFHVVKSAAPDMLGLWAASIVLGAIAAYMIHAGRVRR